MRMTILAVAILVLVVGHDRAGAADQVAFERDIAPLLVRRCASCHNDSQPSGGLSVLRQASIGTGGESGEPAVVPGESNDSPLLARIVAGEMPPKGPAVPPAEQAALQAWIDSGAAWPEGRVLSPFEWSSSTRAGRDWWSLQAPRRLPVPVVKRADRVRTPIDSFLIARLEREGLELNPDVDREALIRRAALDVLGLPPSPEEIAAFVSDPADDAFEKVVDRMLASPRYGERWARHWLDVVRFGESNGYETNTARPNAWPYRDWVIRAMNDDMPYPRFVLAQLAGDQIGEDAATGYLVGGPHDVVLSPDVELTAQQRANDLDDMVSTTSAAFLGLTVGCAKCHDHKFDPVSQQDYYALQAIFSGVQHGEREIPTPDRDKREQRQRQVARELESAERAARALWMRYQPLARVESPSEGRRPPLLPTLNVDRFAPVRARAVRFTVLATSGLEPCLDELEVWTAGENATNVALASTGATVAASSVFDRGNSPLHRVEHAIDGRYGNGRSWISAEPGAGRLEIRWLEPATIDHVVWGRDREGKFRDRLATRYRIEASDDGEHWQIVATDADRAPIDPRGQDAEPFAIDQLPQEVRQLLARDRQSIEQLRGQLTALAPPKAYLGTFTRPDPTHVLYRGEPLQKRERVAPSGIRLVAPRLTLSDETPEADRRMALARWIGSPDNPLAARVLVNRLWHHHFGAGLVRTPGDFGFNGGEPSHPELLDWLATELVARDWRCKAIHRLILLSTAYRQSSAVQPAARAKDSQGRLLWRFNPRRLEAEVIRDRVLWTSGVLSNAMGGAGYDVFESNSNYVKVYAPKRAFGPAEWRRMVYQDKPRMRQDATFGEFDCPDASQMVARRNSSTTALQALNLLNSPFMLEQASLLADRLRREAGDDVERQVERAFWLAFGRAVESDERQAACRLIDQEGLLVFCRAMYNANEFLYLN
jgi:hypothetical protein